MFGFSARVIEEGLVLVGKVWIACIREQLVFVGAIGVGRRSS